MYDNDDAIGLLLYFGGPHLGLQGHVQVGNYFQFPPNYSQLEWLPPREKFTTFVGMEVRGAPGQGPATGDVKIVNSAHALLHSNMVLSKLITRINFSVLEKFKARHKPDTEIQYVWTTF